MKDLIAKIKAKFAELRQQANASLEKMRPLEQAEGAEQIGYLFRNARNLVEYLTEISSTIESKLPEAVTEIQEAVRAELRADDAFRQEVAKDAKVIDLIKATLIQSGELLTKTDHEGKVQVAEKAKEDAVRLTITNETAERAKLDTRRGEAESSIAKALKAKLGDEAATVAKEVAAKLPDEKLKLDDYKTLITATEERLVKSVAVGVTKGDTLTEVASMDAAVFEKMHGGWEQIAQSAGAGKVKAPFATTAGKAGGKGDEKPARRLMV